MIQATSLRKKISLVSSRGFLLFSMQFSNQILDLCKKAPSSKERGMEQAGNTEPIMLSSYLKVSLCKNEKCLFFQVIMCIKHKEPSILGGMVPETRPPDSWHTEFLPAKGMFKYK